MTDTAERALHDISKVIRVLARDVLAYIEGTETDHQAKSKWDSYRRVILAHLNAVCDVYSIKPGADSASMRVNLTLDMIKMDVQQFGIIPTDDGELFTFQKPDGEAAS